MTLTWVDWAHPDFIALTRELDAYFRACLDECQTAFDPYNALAALNEVALLYDGATPAACGALKLHADGTAEIKRVFVTPAYRRAGLGRQVMVALEARARELGCRMLLLETNPAFTDAVALYSGLGFDAVENFAPYQGMCTLCMGKPLA
ncbi:MAG: GNAT family N-acetyltransferase [Eubacteriales bacterium]|nr:GNAT family N-acetyltransferase [Eubacteriales bacterium]